MVESRETLWGRGIWNVWWWIALGIVFKVLNIGNDVEPKSPYWFAEIILLILMVGGLWATARFSWRQRLPLSRKTAPLVYVFLVWLFGMMYELSLTVTGEGIGGVHPQTIPSFILAQGDYIPIALVSYAVIRQTRATFQEVFFFAGGKSLTEGLIFTGVLTAVLLSPLFWLSPLVLSYYTLAYSSFIALPLLFVDETLLWQPGERTVKRTIPFFWALGFGLALLIRLFWGLVYSPVVTQLFGLSA
jgi:hypothetical protein